MRGLQKVENTCTAINLHSCRNWVMKGKQPTVYRWIIWRSLRLLRFNETEMIWIISPKKLLSENHEQNIVEKRKRRPDEFLLRIIKALEGKKKTPQPNRHLWFFKDVIPSLQNFKEEETLEFQLGVLQLTPSIKTPKIEQLFHSTSYSVQPAVSYFLTCYAKWSIISVHKYYEPS